MNSKYNFTDKSYRESTLIVFWLWLSMLPFIFAMNRQVIANTDGCCEPQKPQYLGAGESDLLTSPTINLDEDYVTVIKGNSVDELNKAVSIFLNGVEDISCKNSTYGIITKVDCTIEGYISRGYLYINDSVRYKCCDTGESVALDFNDGKYTIYLYNGVWGNYTTEDYELCDCKVVLKPTTLVSQEYRQEYLPELQLSEYNTVNYFSLQGIHEPPEKFFTKSVNFSESFEFMIVNNSTNSIVSVGRKNQETK